jgi:hypothetical protein
LFSLFFKVLKNFGNIELVYMEDIIDRFKSFDPIVYVVLIIVLLILYGQYTKRIFDTSNPSSQTPLVRVPISLNMPDSRDLNAMFVGTGRGVNDKLMVEKNGEWFDIIDQTNLGCTLATYSAGAADVNNDGLSDLVVVREDGVTLYLNLGKGQFEKRKISGANDPQSTVTFSDYNKNGLVDILITQKSSQNVLLEGIGRGVFQDVSVITRLDKAKGASAAKWTDVNHDQIPDLVLYNDHPDSDNVEGTDIYLGNRGGSGGKFATGHMFVKNSDITLTEELNQLASSEVLAKGRKYNDKAVIVGKVPGNQNWIGLKLPDNGQFMNAIIQVVSVDQSTGKVRRQTKQNDSSSLGADQDKLGKVFKIDLGGDDRVLHLEIQTIYDGTRWIHPNPVANKIMTFREFRSSDYGPK